MWRELFIDWRWENWKIVIDWVAFFLVTLDLWGKDRLERSTEKLRAASIWVKEFLELILGFGPPFSYFYQSNIFSDFSIPVHWQQWKSGREEWLKAENGKKWKRKEDLALMCRSFINQFNQPIFYLLFIFLIIPIPPLAVVGSVVGLVAILVYTISVVALFLLKSAGLEGFMLWTGAALFTFEKVYDLILLDKSPP